MDKSLLKPESCYSEVGNCHFDSQNHRRKVQSVILEQFGSFSRIHLNSTCCRFAANDLLISVLNSLQCLTGIFFTFTGIPPSIAGE